MLLCVYKFIMYFISFLFFVLFLYLATQCLYPVLVLCYIVINLQEPSAKQIKIVVESDVKNCMGVYKSQLI